MFGILVLLVTINLKSLKISLVRADSSFTNLVNDDGTAAKVVAELSFMDAKISDMFIRFLCKIRVLPT